MFEQLFGSKTRVKLIKLFLDNPDKSFFVRELTRATDTLINSVRRELDNLIALSLIVEEEKTQRDKTNKLNAKKFYRLNPKCLYRQELEKLFGRSRAIVEQKFISKLKHLGEVNYLALSGFFIDDDKAQTDILMIGQIEKNKVAEAVLALEKEIKREIRYTIMDDSEYRLRYDISDNFLEDILENEKNLILINKFPGREKAFDQF